MLVLEREGEKRVFKSRHKFEIKIKTELKKIGCELIELIHDIPMTRFCEHSDVFIMTENF
jgi:hypothetical protein